MKQVTPRLLGAWLVSRRRGWSTICIESANRKLLQSVEKKDQSTVDGNLGDVREGVCSCRCYCRRTFFKGDRSQQQLPRDVVHSSAPKVRSQSTRRIINLPEENKKNFDKLPTFVLVEDSSRFILSANIPKAKKSKSDYCSRLSQHGRWLWKSFFGRLSFNALKGLF